MSWLFKSLQASDADDLSKRQSLSSPSSSEGICMNISDPSVKEDISAFSQTLGRQIRGVANFLAPPPSSTAVAAVDSSDSRLSSPSSSQALIGIRNDLVEISDTLRTGLSLLSVNSNKAVGEISRLASNLLPFHNSGDDEDNDEFLAEDADGVPGITDEVLKFVTDISARPEYWTGFPLAVELDDTDFKLSDVQRIHISTVEQLIPEISALKLKLQGFIHDELFWMIYFILLLPRFNQDDFELLSTPEIVEARDILLEKLQSKENEKVNSEHTSVKNMVYGTTGNSKLEEKTNSTGVIEDGEGFELYNGEKKYEWSENDYLQTRTNAKERVEVEDISFSDIDEDDENDLCSSKTSATKPPRAPSSSNESSDWVEMNVNLNSQLGGQRKERDSEGEESSDWYNVEDFD